MADRGIIFSGPMVRALLDGRKTQTRRLLTSARVFATPESPAFTLKGEQLKRALQGADRWRHLSETGWFWEADAFDYQVPATRAGWMAHLSYAPGDRLYVREAWRADSQLDAVRPSEMSEGEPIFYEMDGALRQTGCAMLEAGKLRPSIFLPRWASRLWLNVTDVRVQRLQEISGEDAVAEGVRSRLPDNGIAQTDFHALWNSLHTKPSETWEANPWVIALTFTVRHGNIESIPEEA
jgi:hypothetical protein